MIFTEGDTTYTISFKHEQFAPVLMQLALPRMIHGRTTCYIRSQSASSPGRSSDGHVLGTGIAHVSANDPYDYAEGRTRSMKKALAMAWPEDKQKWHKAFELYAHRRRNEPPLLRALRRMDDALQQARHQLPRDGSLLEFDDVLELFREDVLRPQIKKLTPAKAA